MSTFVSNYVPQLSLNNFPQLGLPNIPQLSVLTNIQGVPVLTIGLIGLTTFILAYVTLTEGTASNETSSSNDSQPASSGESMFSSIPAIPNPFSSSSEEERTGGGPRRRRKTRKIKTLNKKSRRKHG
jgi:hypothetical protein